MLRNFQLICVCEFLDVHSLVSLATTSSAAMEAIFNNSVIWRKRISTPSTQVLFCNPPKLEMVERGYCAEARLFKYVYEKKIFLRDFTDLEQAGKGGWYLSDAMNHPIDHCKKSLFGYEKEQQRCIQVRPHFHLNLVRFDFLLKGFTLMCSVMFSEQDAGSAEYPNYLFCQWKHGATRLLSKANAATGEVEITLRIRRKIDSQDQDDTLSVTSPPNVIPLNKWVDIAFTFEVITAVLSIWINNVLIKSAKFEAFSGIVEGVDVDHIQFGRKADSGHGFSGFVKQIGVFEGAIFH